MYSVVFSCREAGIRTVKESITRLEQKYGGSVPMLSPTSDLKISSSKYKKLQSKLRKLEDMLQANCLNTKYDPCSLHALLWDADGCLHGWLVRHIQLGEFGWEASIDYWSLRLQCSRQNREAQEFHALREHREGAR